MMILLLSSFSARAGPVDHWSGHQGQEGEEQAPARAGAVPQHYGRADPSPLAPSCCPPVLQVLCPGLLDPMPGRRTGGRRSLLLQHMDTGTVDIIVHILSAYYMCYVYVLFGL